MKIITSITWNMETLEVVAREDFDYEGPLELCGPSQAQYTAQEQAQSEATSLQNDFNTQFGEQQGLLNSFLIPQLEGMINNPQGFGAPALAAMQSSLVNNVGAQAANATQSANASFDTNNMAGLPSGVEQAIKAQIASGAGNTVAQGANQIQLQNAQEKLAQQQFGYQGLAGAESALGAAPQTGGLAISANQNSANQANTIAQAGNWWQGMLGSAIGAGLGIATGGLSTMASGAGSFLGGGGGAGGAMGLGDAGGGSVPGLGATTGAATVPFY